MQGPAAQGIRSSSCTLAVAVAGTEGIQNGSRTATPGHSSDSCCLYSGHSNGSCTAIGQGAQVAAVAVAGTGVAAAAVAAAAAAALPHGPDQQHLGSTHAL
eukprot:11206850-Lingulodinium_polyedra.AAC.1